MQKSDSASLRCHLRLSGSADGHFQPHIEIENRGDSSFSAPYYHPLPALSFSARRDGEPVEIEIPESNVPVEMRTLTIPPGKRVPLPTAVQFGFGEGKQEAPFTYALQAAPGPIEMRVEAELGGVVLVAEETYDPGG